AGKTSGEDRSASSKQSKVSKHYARSTRVMGNDKRVSARKLDQIARAPVGPPNRAVRLLGGPSGARHRGSKIRGLPPPATLARPFGPEQLQTNRDIALGASPQVQWSGCTGINRTQVQFERSTSVRVHSHPVHPDKYSSRRARSVELA